jgi:AbrB family looped-hinge helix DNA binding protein
MRTTISSKGQIVLPSEIRKQDGIRPGQEFDIERVSPGEYVLKRVARRSGEGLVDWLLSCPEKGWFQPLDGTETTDRIKPSKFK